MISTLSKLGNFSKAMWKARCTELHDPNNTSSPTADLDAEITLCYANPQDLLAADRQLLHKSISKVLKSRRPAKTKFLRGIRSAHRRFFKDASKGSIQSATSLNRQFPILHPLILSFVFHKDVLSNPTPVLRLSTWTRPG
jgi:hypothetical protein